MNYEYMLLLRQTGTFSKFSLPDLWLFFVAEISYFNSYSWRAGCRLPHTMADLLAGFYAP